MIRSNQCVLSLLLLVVATVLRSTAAEYYELHDPRVTKVRLPSLFLHGRFV